MSATCRARLRWASWARLQGARALRLLVTSRVPTVTRGLPVSWASVPLHMLLPPLGLSPLTLVTSVTFSVHLKWVLPDATTSTTLSPVDISPLDYHALSPFCLPHTPAGLGPCWSILVPSALLGVWHQARAQSLCDEWN